MSGQPALARFLRTLAKELGEQRRAKLNSAPRIVLGLLLLVAAMAAIQGAGLIEFGISGLVIAPCVVVLTVINFLLPRG